MTTEQAEQFVVEELHSLKNMEIYLDEINEILKEILKALNGD